jgi:restriction endonuclease S subunit
VLENIKDLGPDDELRETLDEKAEGEMQRIMKQGPELLTKLGQIRILHPVEIDEEDGVDCCRRGSYNANC